MAIWNIGIPLTTCVTLVYFRQLNCFYAGASLLRGGMNDLVDLDFFSGKRLKILAVLSSEQSGLTLEALAQHCLVRDLNSLRKLCQELEQNLGMLVSRRGAHGQQTWSLVGRLDLIRGRLFWAPQNAEISLAKKAQPEPEVGKNPGRENELRQKLEKPQAGGARAGLDLEKSPNWPVEIFQRVENSRSGGDIDSLKPDLKNRLVYLDSRETDNQELLKNASLLFGKPVNWQASFSKKQPDEILAWLAQAWQARISGRSDRPWGLVYRGLLGELRQKQPDKRYRDAPWEYLPDDYLEACGLAHSACSDFDLVCRSRVDPDADQDQIRPEPEDPGLLESEVAAPVSTQSGRILSAWQAVLGQLDTRMSRSAFQAWVCDTLPVGWDEASGLLSVAASSAEAVEWLDSRLASAARRMLCGILDCEVELRFVVS